MGSGSFAPTHLATDRLTRRHALRRTSRGCHTAARHSVPDASTRQSGHGRPSRPAKTAPRATGVTAGVRQSAMVTTGKRRPMVLAREGRRRRGRGWHGRGRLVAASGRIDGAGLGGAASLVSLARATRTRRAGNRIHVRARHHDAREWRCVRPARTSTPTTGTGRSLGAEVGRPRARARAPCRAVPCDEDRLGTWPSRPRVVVVAVVPTRGRRERTGAAEAGREGRERESERARARGEEGESERRTRESAREEARARERARERERARGRGRECGGDRGCLRELAKLSWRSWQSCAKK